MGLKNQRLSRVEVNFDSALGLDVRSGVAVQGAVSIPEEHSYLGRSGLTWLTALLAPHHLNIARHGGLHLVDQMVDLIDQASSQLLKSEKSARAFALGDETFNGATLPTLTEQLRGGSNSSRFRAKLMLRKGGHVVPWIATRSRNPYFGITGHLLLIQLLATTRPYEEEVVPAAVAMNRFVAGFEIVSGYWQGMGRGVYDLFAERLVGFVASDDPRAEMKQAIAAGEKARAEQGE